MANFQDQLKKKAAVGASYLVLKRVLIQIIYTVSNIFLARLLFPEDFGTFAIVSFVITFFIVFTDLGLGPSLIQKRAKVTTLDLRTAFVFQLLLVSVIVSIIFGTAPLIADFYNLGDKGVLLFRIYSLYLFFLPFKTTSGVLLERYLQYRKLVTVEISEVLISTFTTVTLAILGFGVFSFVIGRVFGHLSAAVFYFVVSPWRLGLAFSKENLRELAKFGLPFQSRAVLGLFFGPLVLLYLGKIVGEGNLGFYQFAASLAVLPMAVSEVVNRVIFPLGARLQKDKLLFRRLIERTLVVVSSTTLPLLTVGLAAAPQIIHFVYTDKWLPSLPALYLGLLQMALIAYTGIFAHFLLSRGRADVMRNMNVVWAILTWILAPPLIAAFDFVGMSITGLAVSASGLWLFFRLRGEVKFTFRANFFPYLVPSVVAGLVVFGMLKLLPPSLVTLVLAVVLAVLLYIGLLLILARKAILESLMLLVGLVTRRNQ